MEVSSSTKNGLRNIGFEIMRCGCCLPPEAKADLGLVLITYHLSHFHADYPRNLELSATILNFATSNN
jgi:hypothetical protein